VIELKKKLDSEK